MVSLETLNDRIAYIDSQTIIKDNKYVKKKNNAGKKRTTYEATLNARLKSVKTINSEQIDLKDCIGPAFYDMHCDIRENKHTYYDLEGGRGSLKSSFVSLEIVLGMKQDPNANAVVYRKVADTLALSVYEQILWAIEKLGMADEWKCTKSPMMCEYLPHGTRIIFKGLDKAKKSKSLKFSKGYAKYLWFEEFDEFASPEEIRSVQQSVLRGGDTFIVFKSMNPPKSRTNWANSYMEEQSIRPDTYCSKTTYLQAPAEWLGQQFIDDAEWLKITRPDAYEHEYLGVPIGNGADIFENVETRRITDEELKHFDNIYMGIDWGWYPDPFAWIKVYYDTSRRTLYLMDEWGANKTVNSETWSYLQKEKGVTHDTLITADSAEPKSIGDYKIWGANIRGAEKGEGSIKQGIKWLQSLSAIVIDPTRTPKAYNEFIHYELELDKDGNPINDAYPDANNHWIDATRYALERYSKRRGN